MSVTKEVYEEYIGILKEELVPALGCTEPIAVAYAAARARELLDEFPDSVQVECSGNIFKNVKCVVVPNTGNLTGMKAGAVIGVVGGDSALGLQVLGHVTAEDIQKTQELIATDFCKISLLDTPHTLHIIVTVTKGKNSAKVEVRDFHDHIVYEEKNGKVVMDRRKEVAAATLTDRSCLNFETIYEFAKEVSIADVKDMLDRQINYNIAIAEEGLKGTYGVHIGKTVLRYGEDNVFTKMRAYTTAASEARMSGCTKPVVTNSGSGNQGIATSVPLIVYARENDYGEIRLYRALVFANLLTIYQKNYIGRLSACCGAVSSTCASMAGVGFLEEMEVAQIKMIIQNTLADDIGVVCDGAKPSCAAKILCGLDCAINAYFLAKDNVCYDAHSGILKADIDETIKAVGRMAACGMKDTDREILSIMMEDV